jgi:Icc-related predicted phosphoesterase
MKVLVLGDIHNEFGRLNEILHKKRPDLIISCGDFGYWPNWNGADKLERISTHGAKLLFCDGNHDDHWALRDRKQDELAPNIIYMPRGSTYELDDGRTIMFMGGAHSIDKHLRTAGWDWFPEEIITQKDMNNLPEKKIDIFITHTCPEELVHDMLKYYPEKAREPSNTALSELWKIYKPKLWIFGHWHHYNEGIMMGTQWYALSYPGEATRWWMWLPEKEEVSEDSDEKEIEEV